MDKFLKTVADELPFLVFLAFGAGLIVFWQWAAIQRRRMAHAERLPPWKKACRFRPSPGPTKLAPAAADARGLPAARVIWSAIGLGIVVAGATAAYFTAPYSDRQMR